MSGRREISLDELREFAVANGRGGMFGQCVVPAPTCCVCGEKIVEDELEWDDSGRFSHVACVKPWIRC